MPLGKQCDGPPRRHSAETLGKSANPRQTLVITAKYGLVVRVNSAIWQWGWQLGPIVGGGDIGAFGVPGSRLLGSLGFRVYPLMCGLYGPARVYPKPLKGAARVYPLCKELRGHGPALHMRVGFRVHVR